MTVGAGLSNLQLRIVSALVLAVAVLTLTWTGGVWFRLMAAAMGLAILYEWTGMALTPAAKAHRMVLAAVLLVVVALLVAGISSITVLLALAAAIVVGVAHAVYAKTGFWPVAGVAYAGLSAVSLAAIRGDDAAGFAAALFLFAVVWATDIAAYFVGRAVGGPKLAPSISPGKTWSGAIGGAAGAVLAGVAVAACLGSDWRWAALFVLVMMLSIVSQLGDLFESSFKRRYGAKDSGQLIPGHGGVMDRVDGLVAAALALFIVGAVLASPDSPASALFM